MGFNLIWIFALLVLLAIFKLAPGLARRITLAWLGEQGRADVGREALAKQPDEITLVPRATPLGADAEAILLGLVHEGLDRAGRFSVPEMGGLLVDFMVKPAESAVAAIYEHPRAGAWLDLFTRYEDGTSFTFTTAPMGGGLSQRPGHPTVRTPALAPAAAHARFLQERTAGAMRSFGAAAVPAMFAAAYAESIAWRKQRGISAAEVQKVGMEKLR